MESVAYKPQGFYCLTAMPVLEFLWGESWDDRAYGIIYMLRPSAVRVIAENERPKEDVMNWRVSVYLKGKSIDFIEQDVYMCTPKRIDGSELKKKLGLE